MVVLAALIVLREVLISGVREYLGAIKLPVTMIAKWKTTAQLLAVGAGLVALRVDHEVHKLRELNMTFGREEDLAFGPESMFFLYIYSPVMLLTLGLLLFATLLTLISGWGYMRQALEHLRTPEVFR
jgi:phosphatidylglycerophosphate synthase